METRRLVGLDALRGVAALCVVLFHLPLAFSIQTAVLEKAYLAVDFFFMLSGFVLTRTYQQRFKAGLGAPAFMVSRLKRLWPTIAIGMVLGFFVSLEQFGLGTSLVMLAAGLAMIPMLGGQAIFPLNGVIWSIFFELFANVIHGTLLWRYGRHTLLAAIAVLFGTMAVIAASRGNFDVGSWSYHFAMGFPRVLFSYLIGMWLYLTWGDKPPVAIPFFLTFVAMPAIFVIAWATGFLGWQFDLLFVTFVCPLLVAGGLATVDKFRAAAQFLGDLSYPIYAVHVPIIYGTAKVGGTWPMAVALAVLAAWIVARTTGPGSAARLREIFSRRIARETA